MVTCPHLPTHTVRNRSSLSLSSHHGSSTTSETQQPCITGSHALCSLSPSPTLPNLTLFILLLSAAALTWCVFMVIFMWGNTRVCGYLRPPRCCRTGPVPWSVFRLQLQLSMNFNAALPHRVYDFDTVPSLQPPRHLRQRFLAPDWLLSRWQTIGWEAGGCLCMSSV